MLETNPESRWPRVDAQWLDRLVDGELSAIQRRELISRVEQEPEGWRSLALGFLEAQAWRQILGGPREEPAGGLPPSADDWSAASPIREFSEAPPTAALETAALEPASVRPGQMGRRAAGSRRWAESLLALAASFVLAFGLGIWLRDWQSGGAAPLAGGAVPLANRSATSAAQAALASGAGTASSAQADPMVPVEDAPEPGAVDLVWTTSGQPRSVQLPVMAPEKLLGEWLAQRPQELPPETEQALSRSGHRLARWRQLWPVTLDDGQVVEVPVEQMQIRYVADDYQ